MINYEVTIVYVSDGGRHQHTEMATAPNIFSALASMYDTFDGFGNTSKSREDEDNVVEVHVMHAARAEALRKQDARLELLK